MNWASYGLDDWKLVYRVLHSRLTKEMALLDCAFFEDLQVHLQQKAREQGVDGTDHGAWDAWLGNAAASCAVRIAKREILPN